MKLSKVIHWLLLTLAVKLVVLGTLAWNITIPDGPIAVSQVAQEDVSNELFTEAAKADDVDTAPQAAPVVRAIVNQNQAWAQNNATASGEPESQGLSRSSLAKRQEELNRREQSLKALEKQIDQKLAQMQELEAKLQRMLEDAEETKDKKLRHLVDVYSNMKAKQAATVLETLDEDIAVKILAGMRGRQAGEVLTYVKPAKAARLSEALTRMQIPYQ